MKRRGSMLLVLLLTVASRALWAQDQRTEEARDYYQDWLKKDVVYIITDEERAIFNDLKTDDERERFIELFWRRRDPDPQTPENEFVTEHYRRIAYANEKFFAGIPGWRTDRGKIYITQGPPAQVDVYPTGTVLKDVRGGSIQGIGGEGRGGVRPREIRTYPFEVWRYRYIEGIGTDVELEFVDKTGAGLYKLAMDDEEKNVFAFKDPAADVASLNRSEFLKTNRQRQFYRTELMAKLAAPPVIRFNDLQQVVSSRIQYDQIPFKASTAILQVTDSSFFVPVTITIPARHLEFREVGETRRASVNLFFQATNLQKRIVAVVEDTLELAGPSRQLSRLLRGTALYQKKMLLPPGRYVLDLVVKDTNSEKMGSMQRLLVVERPSSQVSLSSLIPADVIRTLNETETLADPFAFGIHKIVPNVEATFRQSKRFGLFFQIYGLAVDQAVMQPSVEMRFRFKQGDKVLLELTDDLSRFGTAQGEKASVSLSVPLNKFPEGRIDLDVEVKDKIREHVVTSKTSFMVVAGAS